MTASEHIHIRATPAQKAQIEAAAAYEHRSVTNFVLACTMGRAKEILKLNPDTYAVPEKEPVVQASKPLPKATGVKKVREKVQTPPAVEDEMAELVDPLPWMENGVMWRERDGERQYQDHEGNWRGEDY